MAWFKRKDKGIQTPTEAKKDTPRGLWYKTPSGKIIDTEELKRNLYVSPEDWLYSLAYQQFTPEEFANGTAVEILMDKGIL